MQRQVNPRPGSTILLAFNETDVQQATILQYEETMVADSCDLSTEFMMVQIDGIGIQCLTRHTILPEEDQTWCMTTLGDRMVEVHWELEDILIGPAELLRIMNEGL